MNELGALTNLPGAEEAVGAAADRLESAINDRMYVLATKQFMETLRAVAAEGEERERICTPAGLRSLFPGLPHRTR